MQEIRVRLTEPEAQCLKELAQQAGISVEEAASRAIRHVLKEVMPVNPQFYEQRSRIFWENYRHLLRRNGGGQ